MATNQKLRDSEFEYYYKTKIKAHTKKNYKRKRDKMRGRTYKFSVYITHVLIM